MIMFYQRRPSNLDTSLVSQSSLKENVNQDKVVRHLCQRLGILIVRDNAMMMASRHPTFAPPDIDGDED